MTFLEVVNRLNTLVKESTNLSNFQKLRAEIKGLSKARTYNLFSKSTIFDDGLYAFHDGGRSEIQFNIGVEELNGRLIFRYGLGFSLDPNQTQPDPVNFITPKIRAFNTYFQNNSGLLDDLFLWHYKAETETGRSRDFPIQVIPDEWISWNNFIFIGKYFSKDVNELNDSDLQNIIALFGMLLPVFVYVESTFLEYQLKISGERISRVCWNEYGWVKPSGRNGKSTDQNTHEGQFGYGNEEWIGDTGKLIDGYHYAFLETIRDDEGLVGKFFNVDLFTINEIEKKRYMVGKITNLEVIDSETSDFVQTYYESQGWIQEMEGQLATTNADNSNFREWRARDLFNVRFRPRDLTIYNDYVLTNDSTIHNIKRYTLAYKTSEIKTVVPIDTPFIFQPNLEDEGEQIGNAVDIITYERTAKPIEILYLHKKIRDELKILLTEKFGKHVDKEVPTGLGTLIDVVRRENEKIIFYEIKTYNNIKSCIREALGQLLEYAFWPNSDNANELIIVSHNEITEQARVFLEKLRRTYQLPIFYQHFNLERQELSEKY